MASTATLNWTPFGGSTTGQRLEYRDTRSVSNTWQTVSGYGLLAPTVNTIQVPTLLDNVLYEFRIVSICSATENPSLSTKGIGFTCPLLLITPGIDNLQVSYTGIGASITGYVLSLYDASGTLLETRNNTTTSTTVQTYIFDELESNTDYQVRLTLVSGTYSKDCSLKTAHTLIPVVAACVAPTLTSAEIS